MKFEYDKAKSRANIAKHGVAFEEAKLAAREGEIPVGAVVYDVGTGRIVASARNRTLADCDPSAHAEILALRAAGKIAKSARMPEFGMYVTLEPCPMCAAAIGQARLSKLRFGAWDEKGGGVESGPRVFANTPNLKAPDVAGGICEGEASALLKGFFAALRVLILAAAPFAAAAAEPSTVSASASSLEIFTDYLLMEPIWVDVVDPTIDFPSLVSVGIKVTPRTGRWQDVCDVAARLQDAFIVHFNRNPPSRKDLSGRALAATGYGLLQVARNAIKSDAVRFVEATLGAYRATPEQTRAKDACFRYHSMK